jgi:hypothetical protein
MLRMVPEMVPAIVPAIVNEDDTSDEAPDDSAEDRVETTVSTRSTLPVRPRTAPTPVTPDQNPQVPDPQVPDPQVPDLQVPDPPAQARRPFRGIAVEAGGVQNEIPGHAAMGQFIVFDQTVLQRPAKPTLRLKPATGSTNLAVC